MIHYNHILDIQLSLEISVSLIIVNAAAFLFQQKLYFGEHELGDTPLLLLSRSAAIFFLPFLLLLSTVFTLSHVACILSYSASCVLLS